MGKNKFEIPHADRFIGLPKGLEDVQAEWEKHSVEVFRNNGSAKKEGFEVEKSERDICLIEFVESRLIGYMKEYGRIKDIELSLENIHLLKVGGTEEYTEQRFANGAHSAIFGSVIVDRVPSDVEFSLVLFHELFHLKSYKAIQVLPDTEKYNTRLKEYRSGLCVISRDGDKTFFTSLEEAVVGIMTNRFYNEFVLESELYKEEVERIKKDRVEVDTSRMGEVEKLNKIVDDLWNLNKEEFENREGVMNLFIDAQINGNILSVARLVEKTFGKGSFRKLGEDNEEVFE